MEYTTLICYVVYFVYIVIILIDWDSMPVGGDWISWIILTMLMISLMIMCICYNLHINGYHVLGISSFQFILMIVVLITFVILVILYQQWYNYCTWDNIKYKLSNKTFIHLGYQYGGDLEDIRRKLHLTVDDFFPLYSRQSLQEIWEIFMGNSEKVKSTINKIMGGNLRDDIDVSYNLLWYLCISDNPLGSHLTISDKTYLLTLTNNELEQLLGQNYYGAKDRASLLFAVLSGESVPPFEFTNRYEVIKKYLPTVVYNLAFNQHKIIDHDNGTYSLYPPHVYLSRQPESPIETIISNLNNTDYNEIIQKLGLISPNYNDEILQMNNENKINYLQGELSMYHNVLTRPEGLIQPPNIYGMSPPDIMNVLSHYTNAELINAYEPRTKCKFRRDIIRQIYNDVTGIPQWSFTHMHCTNDNTMNILTADLHRDINKDDLDDPTLSFGIHKNYRCYQVTELEASFREYDGGFSFRVPDWVPDAHPDPILDSRLISRKEFSLDSIKQLHNLLQQTITDGCTNSNILSLFNKIKIGLDSLNSAHMQTLYLKRQYDSFTNNQKEIVHKYIAWLFMYSMWMRFWKGPGFPWPITKVNVRRQLDRITHHRSSPEDRDEHIFIQESVRTSLIESFENDPVLAEWINTLPAIYYDFITKDAKCASYPIKQTLDQIAIGDFCMGFGSDTILKTSYFYIINLFNISEGSSFDNFIHSFFPSLLDLEYHVVTSHLASLHSHTITNTSKHRVLTDRLTSLQQPIPLQPPFDPSKYQNNTHVD